MHMVQVNPESGVQQWIVGEADTREVRVKRDERLEMPWQTGVHVPCKLSSNAGEITTALASVGNPWKCYYYNESWLSKPQRSESSK